MPSWPMTPVERIGIRMALGAQARAIAAMFVRESGWMVSAGVIIGCAGAVAANRAIASLLFGVTPTDPMIFGLCVLTLLATSLLACWLPARRAARVDTVQSLRAERIELLQPLLARTGTMRRGGHQPEHASRPEASRRWSSETAL